MRCLMPLTVAKESGVVSSAKTCQMWSKE